MSERTQAFMNAVWEARNADVDTEEKLVAAVLKIAAETVRFYQAQDGRIVLDREDMVKLAQELEE